MQKELLVPGCTSNNLIGTQENFNKQATNFDLQADLCLARVPLNLNWLKQTRQFIKDLLVVKACAEQFKALPYRAKQGQYRVQICCF